ncbi:hypothetical protein IIA95_03200 [Patescibacteria group bacterium]|nr:hypothetical protein [Patescibacteria group bacterium]
MNFKNPKIIIGILLVLVISVSAGYYLYTVRYPIPSNGDQEERTGKTEEKDNVLNPSGPSIGFDPETSAALSAGQWIDLGLKRKAEEDLEGARDAWEKAASIDPNRAVIFHNLGVIYGYYLNDLKRAEENFLASLQKDPKRAYLRIAVFEFYRDVAKDPEKAKNILQQGISADVDFPDALRALLEKFNR